MVNIKEMEMVLNILHSTVHENSKEIVGDKQLSPRKPRFSCNVRGWDISKEEFTFKIPLKLISI